MAKFSLPSYDKSLENRNMYLDVGVVHLKVLFSKCNQKQLIMHGKEMKALVLSQPNQLNENQRRYLIDLLKYCRRLYYKTE